jgi:hypothetical protein
LVGRIITGVKPIVCAAMALAVVLVCNGLTAAGENDACASQGERVVCLFVTADNEYTVTILPAPAGNPLARQILVSTAQPTSLAAVAWRPGEPGATIAEPFFTRYGTEHALWFYGLFAGATFTFAIFDAAPGAGFVAGGYLTVPARPWWIPRPLLTINDPSADPATWIAMSLNSAKPTTEGFELYNALVVYDRTGRLRYFHEMSPPPLEDYAPVSGLVPLSNGDLVLTNRADLVAARPDGSEYLLFDLHLAEPYFKATHHQFYVTDYDAETAWVLFNQFGPGLKCDLVTPTERAVGDGVSLVDKQGYELWRWTVFDHQDEIPPDAMEPSACWEFHYGLDTYDWTHGNAVVPFPSENAVLVSLRNVLRLIKVDVATGEIVWQMGPGLEFEWLGSEPEEDKWFRLQHDPQWLPDGNLLLFDNGNCRYDDNCFAGPWSRGLELVVDEEAKTVEVAWEYRVPFSHARGNIERHPDGNTLLCNGWAGDVIEVTPGDLEIWRVEFNTVFKISTARYYPAMWIYPP